MSRYLLAFPLFVLYSRSNDLTEIFHFYTFYDFSLAK